METVVAALIVLTLLLFGGLMLAQQHLLSQESMILTWQTMEARLETRAQTDLATVGAETRSSGAVIEMTLRNDGQTKLADFEHWDLIVEYQSATGTHIEWLPYTAGAPTNNEWSVSGIYVDAAALTPEAYDPDILNPGEEMVLRARVLPVVQAGSVNRVMVRSTNGIGATAIFTR